RASHWATTWCVAPVSTIRVAGWPPIIASTRGDGKGCPSSSKRRAARLPLGGVRAGSGAPGSEAGALSRSGEGGSRAVRGPLAGVSGGGGGELAAQPARIERVRETTMQAGREEGI